MLVLRGLHTAAPAPTVLTIGNFDGVHLGHRALLRRLADCAEQAKYAEQSPLLPAVLTFEPHPREFFAPESAPTRLSTLREKLELLADYGPNVLFVCGGGSIKKNGVYDAAMKELAAAGKIVTEFGGVPANPTYSLVLKGAALAKEKNTDFILAAGGGSV